MTLSGRRLEIQNFVASKKYWICEEEKGNHNFSSLVWELAQFRLNDESQDICTNQGKISVTQRGSTAEPVSVYLQIFSFHKVYHCLWTVAKICIFANKGRVQEKIQKSLVFYQTPLGPSEVKYVLGFQEWFCMLTEFVLKNIGIGVSPIGVSPNGVSPIGV